MKGNVLLLRNNLKLSPDSYELVALETQNVEHENPGEDSVDFVAATTAALGVPSPCLSKTSSFQDSPPAAVELRKLRKGDLEEETELLQALQLSQGNGPAPNAHGDSANLDSAFTFSDASPTSTLGEECVNAVAPPVCADKEPVYEGESLLGKRAEKNVDDCSSEGNGLTAKEDSFACKKALKNVNGDTAFMTATFKEFKIDSSTTGASGTWDEQNAVTNTADYLASMPDTGIEVNSDLQLAIALQQQEFEDQSPRSNPTPQPPTSIGASRLITGPQIHCVTIAGTKEQPQAAIISCSVKTGRQIL
ncbi:hypothetical protein HID58_086870 [Brassica napus]|uniref:Uncharacterized protein n=1 Tax=Brassica napus TaxID=3708 RepID=A0ABQ7XRT1_BRANA|nr:hypothetical protein HID58_086870 [Brassica napus]